MPELPEVEVLVRHLHSVLPGKKIRGVELRRARTLFGATVEQLREALIGATIRRVTRRGKYLVLTLKRARQPEFPLIGHLGMTGRMYLQPGEAPLAKHAALVLDLGKDKFVFEDTRYFGRFMLSTAAVDALGPEPLDAAFFAEDFAKALKRSSQPIKVKLLDQALVAGVGNIYASEALFRARISPRKAANQLTAAQIKALHQAIRVVLQEAIDCGSTIALDWHGTGRRDGLFYYGSAPDAPENYSERLQVYDRAGQPCFVCKSPIKRLVQAARSTFYCPRCQGVSAVKTPIDATKSRR